MRRRSPAARAGVHKDDLVIGANGRPVSKLKTLRQVIDACSPGDVLELTVLRDNKVHKIRVELESKG
ncbi:MAG: PDZ domain-containing protein [Planctomycetes bacterium]|nr:PDZ domain-containing protein [Planctomycetota bacterium]